jgi:serine/threonine protein kinase
MKLAVESAEGGLEGIAGVSCGDVIAGKYRIESVLGVGGMGVVVAARHLELEESVAIKLLLPHMRSVDEAMVRFGREAKAAVKLKNEHAARVFDVGTLDNGTPYMVMELLEGRDLGAWLVQDGPLRIEQAVDFLLQACVATADAHALGIVHRDIKPSNLFCARRSDGQPSIKVLDFGISKATLGTRQPHDVIVQRIGGRVVVFVDGVQEGARRLGDGLRRARAAQRRTGRVPERWYANPRGGAHGHLRGNVVSLGCAWRPGFSVVIGLPRTPRNRAQRAKSSVGRCGPFRRASREAKSPSTRSLPVAKRLCRSQARPTS